MHEQVNLFPSEAPDELPENGQDLTGETPRQAKEDAPASVKYYPIDEGTARRAHEMMSFRDYRPGSATAEYRAAVDKAAELVERKKQSVSPYYHDKLDALLDRYARRLAKWKNDYNRNGASCPSVMICGPANFPTRKKERQNAREESLWQEYKTIEAILSKIESIGTGPVDLADPHAREILTDQLAAHQKALDDAKAANAYYRKHKTLDGCPGISPREKEYLTRPGVFAKGDGSPLELYGCPFPAYELQSRRGYIQRVQARLAELDNRQAQQDTPAEEYDGFRIVRNLEADRLQILFDGKPEESIRSALKSNGFRWSPRYNAWQRQLTRNAELAAKIALGLD